MAALRLEILKKFTTYLDTLSGDQKKTYNERLVEAMRLHKLAQEAAFEDDEVYEPLKTDADRAANALSDLMPSGGGRRRYSGKSSRRRRHRRSRRASRRAH